MSAALLLKVGLGLTTFLSFFLLGRLVGAAPSPAVRRTGMRGFKRQKMLASGKGIAPVEPLLRWIGARVRHVVSEQHLAAIDRKVCMAGDYMGLHAEEMVALSIVASALGGAVGVGVAVLLKSTLWLAAAIAAFGAVAPFMTLSSVAADRLKSIGRRLPPAIELLALGLGAGLDFPGALRMTVDHSGTPDDPLVEELSLILLNLSLGRSRREALDEFADRAPTPIVQEFVGSVVQAELRGNPVADVLQIQADVLRQKRSVLGEEAASNAAVQMIGPLMLLFLAILIVIVAPIAIQLKAQGL